MPSEQDSTPVSQDGPIKPRNFDLNYREWFAYERERRTLYGRLKLYGMIVLVAFVMLIPAVFILLKNWLARFIPDTYKRGSNGD